MTRNTSEQDASWAGLRVYLTPPLNAQGRLVKSLVTRIRKARTFSRLTEPAAALQLSGAHHTEIPQKSASLKLATLDLWDLLLLNPSGGFISTSLKFKYCGSLRASCPTKESRRNPREAITVTCANYHQDGESSQDGLTLGPSQGQEIL